MYGIWKFLVLPLLCPSPSSFGSRADTTAPFQQNSPAGALQPPAQVLERPPCRSMTTHPGPTAAPSPWHYGCWDAKDAMGQMGAGAPRKLPESGSRLSSPTPQAPHPSWREEHSCPTPHTHPWTAARPHSLISIPERPALALGCTREYDYAHFID